MFNYWSALDAKIFTHIKGYYAKSFKKWFRPLVLQRVFKLAMLALVYSIVSATVLNLFMDRFSFLEHMSRASFNKVLTFSADRPFAYRVFMPVLINSTASIIPRQIVETKRDYFLSESPLIKYVKNKNEFNLDVSLKYHIAYGLLFLCLLLILTSLRYLLRIIYSTIPYVIADYAPAIALLLLPLTYMHGGYVYDFPELLLTIICIITIIKKRWMEYYLLFAIAVLNKELSVLIVIYFLAFVYKKIIKIQLAKHIALHMVIGGGLIFVIRYVMAENPGGGIEYWLPQNLNFWLHPGSYFLWFDSYGPGIPFPRPGNIILISLIGVLIFYKWQLKPLVIKRIFIAMASIMIPLFLCFGWFDEVRALYIIYPPIFILAVFTIWTVYFPTSSATGH